MGTARCYLPIVLSELVNRPAAAIQQRWAQHVASLRTNAILHHVYALAESLFGAERVSLAPVTNALRDLQDGRWCFYCRRKVGRDRHVDSFIPWSRYRDNGLDTPACTDGACTVQKHAYLAGVCSGPTGQGCTAKTWGACY